MASTKRTGTKKRKTKKSKKQAKRIIFFILFIVLAVFLFFYRTNPAFQAKVDSTVQTAVTFTDSILNPESTEQTTTSQNQQTTTPQESTSAAAVTESETVSENGLILLSNILAKPVCPAQNHAADHELRDYQHYSICYRESYEQAEWSAYMLDDSQLVKNAGRSDDFRPDPQISTGSATLADYKGSGYDRGHLSPAADFSFSQEAMSETFYMSNMSPQAGGFNRGIWKDLEAEVREWTKKFGRIFVVSGPVLDEPAESYETIGKNKVAIPKYYYKVLLAPLYADEEDRASKDDSKSLTGIAFIFPNKKLDGSFFDYAVSIDEAEKSTGIDFFASLNDDIENKIESTFDIELWK